jgi:PD-(D/E)XK nuclease superfamily
MELILRGSEYTDFLTCRKKWYWSWVEKITPKRPDGKLFFGTLFHKWMEFYYNSDCNKLQADLETSVWFNDQDTKDMEQTEIDEVKELFKGVTDHYHNTYGDHDSKFKVLATELEFVVKLQDDIYYTGTIDLVYELDGKIRFSDHKTVASISMYEEKARMDRQISRYWWALQQIAAGIGMVRDRNPAVDRWITFPDLIGKEIDGFDYNLINKDFPREPKQLKPKKGETVGQLSQDKAQKTTYNKYFKALVKLGLPLEPYTEFLEMLKNKPDPFLKRIDVQRTQKELESSIWELLYTGGDIHDVKLLVTEKPEMVEMVTYRNIGTHCEHMCQFKSLCMAEIAGENVSLVRNLGYKKNEER